MRRVRALREAPYPFDLFFRCCFYMVEQSIAEKSAGRVCIIFAVYDLLLSIEILKLFGT